MIRFCFHREYLNIVSGAAEHFFSHRVTFWKFHDGLAGTQIKHLLWFIFFFIKNHPHLLKQLHVVTCPSINNHRILGQTSDSVSQLHPWDLFYTFHWNCFTALCAADGLGAGFSLQVRNLNLNHRHQTSFCPQLKPGCSVEPASRDPRCFTSGFKKHLLHIFHKTYIDIFITANSDGIHPPPKSIEKLSDFVP